MSPKALRPVAIASVALVGVALGCSGGGGKPKIAGTVTVHAVDSLGKPVPGLSIASSARGTVLAEATTDGSGDATLGVAQDGEITTYKKVPSAYVSRTLFGVSPGTSVEIPTGFYQGGPTNVSVTLTSTTDYSAATLVQAYAGYRAMCRQPVTLGTPATLDVDTTCLQTDGTWTLTGLAYGDTGLLGYAVVPDLPVADPAPAVVHGTSGNAVASVAAFVKHVPQPSQTGDVNQYDTAFYFTRKGQAFGNSYGASGTFNYTSFSTPDARLVEPELADGLEEYLDVSNLDGDYTIASQTTTLDGLVLDALQLLQPPASVSVVAGGRPGVKVIDPSGQGLDTEVGLTWSDGGVAHIWYGWAEAPTMSGTRTLTMPPAPTDQAGFRPQSGATYDGVAGYYDQDGRPPDFHTAPDPYVPLVRTGIFTRQFVGKKAP